MTLQLDVHPVAAEDADEPIEQAGNAMPPAVERRAAGQRDETGRAAVELVERERAFALGGAQLHARDQPAEVPVALGGFAEHWEHQGRDGRDTLPGRDGLERLDGRDGSYL